MVSHSEGERIRALDSGERVEVRGLGPGTDTRKKCGKTKRANFSQEVHGSSTQIRTMRTNQVDRQYDQARGALGRCNLLAWRRRPARGVCTLMASIPSSSRRKRHYSSRRKMLS